MNGIWEKIKAHPLLIGVGLVAAFVLYKMLSGGGGTAATAQGTGSDVASATALQQAQLQAGAAAGQTQAAVQANQDTIAGQIELAKIQAAFAGTHDSLAANIATQQINANQQTTALVSTLGAAVQTSAINADVAKATVTANSQVQMQQILATALTQQSHDLATVTTAGYSAQLAAAESHDAHSGGLFGGGGFLGLGI